MALSKFPSSANAPSFTHRISQACVWKEAGSEVIMPGFIVYNLAMVAANPGDVVYCHVRVSALRAKRMHG